MKDIDGIVIEEAKISDFENLVPLYDQLSENIRTKPGWESYSVSTDRKLQYDNYCKILNSESKIFNVYLNSKIVGSITLAMVRNFRHGYIRAHIEEFIVDKNYRHIGIGTQIIQYVIDFCKNNNIKVIKLNAGRQLKDSHKFYESKGFKFTDRGYRYTIN